MEKRDKKRKSVCRHSGVYETDSLWCLYCLCDWRLKSKLTGRFISRNRLQQQHSKVTAASLYLLT